MNSFFNWSAIRQAYLVEAPELAGCMAYGATYQDVVINAERVIGEWLEMAKEFGRHISEPKRRLWYALWL